jgi:hypothetical protein
MIALRLSSCVAYAQGYAPWLRPMMAKAQADAWAAAGLNTGLVSYWAMRNSGTTVTDEYGSNDGTAVNGVLFGSDYGKRDNGAGFDGVNDYISLPSGLRTELDNNSFSVSAWFFSADTTVNAVFNTGDTIGAGDNQGIRFFQYSGSAGFYAAVKGAGGNVGQYSVNDPADNEWVHVVLVRDYGSTVKLYINGQQDWSLSDTAGAITVSKGPWIGAEDGGTPGATPDTSWFKGSIDEVAIWNRALTPTEISKLYSTPLYAPYK